MKKLIYTLILNMLLFSSMALSDPLGDTLGGSSKRSTTINFEDDVIEGINRKPLDSVNQISERDRKNRNHLYKKRAGFLDQDQMLANELRLQQ